jgi:hypothetical protein
MTDHVSTSNMRLFCARTLPEVDLIEIARHLADCSQCHGLLVSSLQEQGFETPRFTLAPEFWLRHEHIDYDQLVSLAENRLDASERESIDAHLKICSVCDEDVRSFLAFRKQIDKELASPIIVEHSTQEKKLGFAWWRGLAWNPAYAAAVLLIGIALVIGVVAFLRRRAANLEAKQTPPPREAISPVEKPPTPENQAVAVQPTPAPVPSEQLPRPSPNPPLTVKNREPLKPIENAGAVAVLNDELGAVTVDKGGNVTGLDEIPQNTRQQIGEALAAQNIKVPGIGTELAGAPINLRGPGEGPTFRLLSPERTVLVSDRPTFEWQRLAGATSYRVLVGDLKGHTVATSELLPSNQTKWTALTPLKRGEIYSWEVEATADGRKIHAPGTTETEMKFKVLSESSVRELEQLQKVRSHLALGVFYANEGMFAEAEHEFQILVRDNPRVPVLKKLLMQIQSWRKQ